MRKKVKKCVKKGKKWVKKGKKCVKKRLRYKNLQKPNSIFSKRFTTQQIKIHLNDSIKLNISQNLLMTCFNFFELFLVTAVLRINWKTVPFSLVLVRKNFTQISSKLLQFEFIGTISSFFSHLDKMLNRSTSLNLIVIFMEFIFNGK